MKFQKLVKAENAYEKYLGLKPGVDDRSEELGDLAEGMQEKLQDIVRKIKEITHQIGLQGDEKTEKELEQLTTDLDIIARKDMYKLFYLIDSVIYK